MSKGLEKLKTIRHIHDIECGKDESINKDFDIIEKELKALEIIKKYVGVQESYDELFPYDIVDKQYVSSGSSLVISKEEYELMREVLK